MEYLCLGTSDLVVSRVGFGCAAMGGYDYGYVDDQESHAAVQHALDLGVNFFDTADVYGLGHAETVLGQALGSRRHDVVVATKVGVAWEASGKTRRDLSAGYITQAVEASLRRLQLDCIPLYQIHWPEGQTPLAETLEALQQLQVRGKIRYIGCCNFSAALIDEAQRLCRLESLQLPYSLIERDAASLLQNCADQYTMTPLTYNALAQGLLTGKYTRDSQFSGTDLRQRSVLFSETVRETTQTLLKRLHTIAAQTGHTSAQVALRWVLDSLPTGVVLTGVKRASQIQENTQVFDWRLSSAEHKALRPDA